MEFEKLHRELAISTEMIRVLIKDIGEVQAKVKPGAGSWSILEVICHLYDEEREDFREHLDFILHRQQKDEWYIIAPMEWVKTRKYNEQDFKTIKLKFFRERARSLAWLKKIERSGLEDEV